MLSMTDARSRVARGAAYLDVARPGWHDRIDVGTLRLSDPCGCIVGQLCDVKLGHFSACSRALFNLDMEAVRNEALGDFGVDIKEADGHESFVVLEGAWIEAILARRCWLKETTAVDSSTDDVRVGQR